MVPLVTLQGGSAACYVYDTRFDSFRLGLLSYLPQHETWGSVRTVLFNVLRVKENLRENKKQKNSNSTEKSI